MHYLSNFAHQYPLVTVVYSYSRSSIMPVSQHLLLSDNT